MQLARELPLAARRLRRSPAFTATALVVLGLGIGATTAMFSIVDGVLLRPLPYPGSEALVDVSHTATVSGATHMNQSDASFLLYQRHNTAFVNIGAYRDESVNFATGNGGAATPQRLVAAAVSASLFPTLGVAPAVGRGFRPGEDRVNGPLVAIISNALWQQSFGGDRSIIGKHVLVNDVSREIVGVMPPNFLFPSPDTRIWLPIQFDAEHSQPASFNYTSVARRKRGVTAAAAATQLDAVLPRILSEFPSNIPPAMWAQAHIHPVVKPLRDVMVGEVSRLLWVFFGAAALLLAIACANVANLFLVRTEGRHRELAVRRALGADRGTLFVQIGSEALVLAGAGGAMGLALSAASIRLLGALPAGMTLPRVAEVTMSPAVVAFAVAVVLATALVLSLVPALRTARIPIASVLKESGRANTGGMARQRTRGVLVVTQVALALVLVAASGLLARSFARLRDVRPGFQPNGLLMMRLQLPPAQYANAALRMQLYGQLAQQASALPGVQDVALTTWAPLTSDFNNDVTEVEDHPLPKDAVPPVHDVIYVSDDYFKTMSIPLIAGRTFGAQDAAHPLAEVVVSRAFAKRYWKGQSPLGKRIRPVLDSVWRTVVGEVGDVHLTSLATPAEDAIYYPIVSPGDAGRAYVPANVAVMVRTDADPATLRVAMQRTVASLDPSLPTYDEHPMATVVAAATAQTRFTMLLLALTSVMALTLGAVGIYGVIMYGVSLRQREIGVRLALGAQPVDVSRMVSRQGLTLAAVGVASGLGASLLATRFLRGLLYGVSPSDPGTLLAASFVLLGVALLASWLPARRAAAVDPAEALRRD